MAEAPGRPLVVVVGSINVDLVVRGRHLPKAGETVTGGTFARHHGGKGANQAVAAARVGAEVRFIGAIGDDELGADERASLVAEGIDVSGVAVVPGVSTGVALIVVDDSGENQIAVASGANAALDAAWVRQALLSGKRRLGVMLLDLEIPDAPLIEAAGLAERLGLRLVVNPAPARALAIPILDAHPLLVMNEDEALLVGSADTPAEAARLLAARSDRPVVVTLGRDGALIAEPDPAGADPTGADPTGRPPTRLPAYPVDAVDTTGAGDTVCGVLAAELARGDPLPPAVRTALAAAALSIGIAGAREGMPSRAALDAILATGPGRRSGP